MSKDSRSNVQFISTARMLGILLVVFGHSYPFEVNIHPALVQIQGFIYLFHMALFICISGLLVAGKESHMNRGYIAARAKKLLIPYFGLSLIAYIPKVLVQSFLNDSADFSLWWLIRSELVPRDNVWGHFWYLPVIFIFGCLSIPVYRLCKEKKSRFIILLLVTFIFMLLPDITKWFSLDDVMDYLFWYILGMGFSQLGNRSEFFKNKIWLIGFPTAVLLFVFARNSLTEKLIAFLMIGFVFSLGTLLNSRKYRLTYQIERYSYTIFLLSWPAQAVVEVVFNKIVHLPYLWVMLMMFAAGIIIPLVIVFMVDVIGKKVNLSWLKVMIGM